jgi:hypothetical protein
MPRARLRVSFHLKCQLHTGLRDRSIPTLRDNPAYGNRTGNKRRRAEFGDLFSDFFVRESGSATTGNEEDRNGGEELKSPVHQDFESSTA